MAEELVVPIMKCNRCGHEWIPRKARIPIGCPACCSPYWNIPRQRPPRKVEDKPEEPVTP